jgi:hypothetical protein
VGIALLGCVLILLAADTRRSAADPGTELLPDLVTLPMPAVVMPRHPKRDLLRLSNEIGNQGAGPLEIFPSDVSENCDGDGDPDNDRMAYQRIYNDSSDPDSIGFFDRNADTAGATERQAGCMIFHPQHNHWHFDNFSRYRLYREDTGRLVARNAKVSFCVIDSDTPFPTPHPGHPTLPYFPTDQGCTATATEGLSIGWADIYGYYLPGQQLNVSGVKKGNFCLVSTADPHDQLSESNENNNTYWTRLFVYPKDRTVRTLKGSCKIPGPIS